MGRSKYIALALTVVLSQLMQIVLFTTGYSFQNCIESQFDHNGFNCINREQTNISALVQDLPDRATSLNISKNKVLNIPRGSLSHLKLLRNLRLDWNKLKSISNAFLNLPQLESLNLSSNQMEKIEPLAFSGLHNLTELVLSNNSLQNFPPQVFSELSNLQYLSFRLNILKNFSEIVESVTHLHRLIKLDLCSNNLMFLNHSLSLPPSLTTLYLCNNLLATLACNNQFLSGIRVLDLSYNKRLQTHSFLFLDLRNVSYLRLSHTQVSAMELLNISNVNISSMDFSGMQLNSSSQLIRLCALLKNKQIKLNNFTLQDNNIERLSNETFSDCPVIKGTMDLSNNHLRNAACLSFMRGQNHLNSIILEHNYLTHLRCRKPHRNLNFRSLFNLSFRYNRIRDVHSFAFNHTPKLQTLQLNINNIAYLDRKALKGLTQLTTLRLDNNLLTDLFENTFSDLYSLKILNVRENRISVIFNRTFHALKCLNILDLGGNKISHFQQEAFVGLQKLAKLYLDRNHLQKIDSYQFGKLRATLQVLDLEGNQIRYLKNFNFSPFENLTQLKDLKLVGQLPYGITLLPNGFFNGLWNLTSLYIGNNRISSLQSNVFDDLASLEFLSLENSYDGLKQLQPGIFKNQRQLKRLNAENMGIRYLSAEVFGNLTNLQLLMLNKNAIQTVDEVLLKNLSKLYYLDLRNNLLSCTCPNSWLQNWTNNTAQVQLVYLYNLTCPDLKGAYFYNFDTNVCYLDLGLYLFAFTSTLIFLLFTTPLLYVKFYWNLKYSYYVFRSWFGERWRRLREEEEQCKYDAFISYNSADEKWVLEQLLPNLEGRGSSFRLCLHHRDFELGRDIVDNIVAAVYGSRKTVCVVSRNYLLSEWCSLEIQLASYRLFHELQDVLLLVFLEPIPDRQLSAYHRMRRVMLKKTYLQWPGHDCADPDQAQELFWSQLRRALRSSNNSRQLEEKELKEAEWKDSKYFGNQRVVDD